MSKKIRNIISVICLVLLFGAASALAISKSSDDKEYSWRYKMTVEVKTPEGIKTGYAVREVNLILTPQYYGPKGEYSSKIHMKGEAVEVDLGERGVLFAITGGYWLGVDHGKNLPFYAFPINDEGFGGETTIKGGEYYSSLEKVKADLKPELYPLLVTFSDINDPKTVVAVLEVEPCNNQNDENDDCVGKPPHVTRDHFEELFGKGVHLENITIEMTNEPITWSISKKLPWLKDYNNKNLDGDTIHRTNAKNKLANSLGSGAFFID